MRLIDGDRLFEIFKNGMIRIPSIEENQNMFYHNSGYNCAMTGAYIEVKKAPTIEAVPVVHGKMITSGRISARCSVCNYLTLEIEANYCQECGAKIDGGAE